MTARKEDLTFLRDTPATRVNSQGLIVGVDFSVSSVTHGLGSKTFVLGATLGINRDYRVGELVSATSQATPLGTMKGTVVSYDRTTQEIVIDVSESDGTGTGTDWRIGSLEVRQDFNPLTSLSNGVVVEVGTTCLTPNNINGATYSASSGVITPTTDIAPDGSSLFYTFTDTNASQYGHATKNAGSLPAGRYTLQVFVKKQDTVFSLQATAPVNPTSVYFNALTGERITTFNPNPNVIDRVIDFGDCFFYQTVIDTDSTATLGAFLFPDPLNAGRTGISAGNTESITYFGLSLLTGDATSFVPTTTVAVSKAADLPSVESVAFSDNFDKDKGTVVVDFIPLEKAVNQSDVISLNDGTLNNELKVVQQRTGTRSSIRSITSDGVTDVAGLSVTSQTNTLIADGVDYEERTRGYTTSTLAAASSGLNNFLCVGTAHSIFSSSDGLNSTVPRGVGLTSCAGAYFGLGRFVIANLANGFSGSLVGGVDVSTDGLSFRRITIAGLAQNLNEITSNGTDQYVAVGDAGVIYTSPDAENWTAQVSGSGANLNGIHYFGGRYVVAAAGAGNSRYSDDGVTWSAITGVNLQGLDVYHNGSDLWVVVGSGGVIHSSPDGINWTPRTSNTVNTLNGVHFEDGLWVAVGQTGTVVTSPDGINWTDRTATSGTASTITEVTYFSGFWYFVGGSGLTRRITTSDLISDATWIVLNTPVTTTLNGIAHNGARLLTCGVSGAINTSDDGITFTSRTGNQTTLTGAAFGNGTYVVVGNSVNGSGLIATVDPVTFAYQRRESGVAGSLGSVRFLNGAFYATVSLTVVRTILRSVDGINWTVITVNGSTNEGYRDITLGNGVYVSVGSGGSIATSSDGVSFSRFTSGVTTTILEGVNFANGIFVAVGNDGTIITSRDSITWTLRPSGTDNDLYAIHYSIRDQQWYAAGDNGIILRSKDAENWEDVSNTAKVGLFKDGNLDANPLTPTKFIPNKRNRIALSWDNSELLVSVNGSVPVSAPMTVAPLLDRLNLGNNAANSNFLNGTIKSTKLYKHTVNSEELQALSRNLYIV